MKHLFTQKLPISLKVVSWFLLKMTVILLAISAFISCRSGKSEVNTGATTVKTKVEQVLPGDSTGFEISRSQITEMEVGSSKQAKGVKTKATLTRTSEQNYQVDCETVPDTVRFESEVTCPPIPPCEPKIIEVSPWWNGPLIGALLAVIVFLLLKQFLSGSKVQVQMPVISIQRPEDRLQGLSSDLLDIDDKIQNRF